jgi:hypothetical protein
VRIGNAAGVTEIDDSEITVNFTDGLVMPERLAVTLAVPAATAVAVPPGDNVAAAVLSLVQVA